jgi:hypothetical protein
MPCAGKIYISKYSCSDFLTNQPTGIARQDLWHIACINVDMRRRVGRHARARFSRMRLFCTRWFNEEWPHTAVWHGLLLAYYCVGLAPTLFDLLVG